MPLNGEPLTSALSPEKLFVTLPFERVSFKILQVLF